METRNGYRNRMNENSLDINLKTGALLDNANDNQEFSEEEEDTEEIRQQK